MKPEIWGPYAWIFLHCITLNYPNNPTMEDQTNMVNFFESLKNIIPCQKCKINFANHLRNKPLTKEVLRSKETLTNWLIDIHNDDNKMNGKKVLNYDDALEAIYYKLNGGWSNMVIIFVVFILIVTIIGIYLWKIWK